MSEKLLVYPTHTLRGDIIIPGDKSISHRAVMLAALANGVSTIRDWLPAVDCWATVNAMRALGVEIEVLSQAKTRADLQIKGVGLHGLTPPDTPIDCDGSGTTMRLLAGILAGQPFETVLDGRDALRRRPMERIAKPLRLLGATVETAAGKPPLQIKGGRLTAIDYHMPVASAQVKSAVLLAGIYAEGHTVVRQPGPARDHTERMLTALSVDLQADGNLVTLNPEFSKLVPFDVAIPGDISSAAFWMVAATLISESELVLPGVNVNPTRTGLVDVLRRMGATIEFKNQRDNVGEPVADIVVGSSPLKGVTVDGEVVVRMIDEFPILAVAATQAQGRTIIRDARELRVKETDRIAAVVTELQKMGADIEARPDGFVVNGPTPLHSATVCSYGDHRMAMALAIAGLLADGETIVEEAAVIADSYPGFIDTLQTLNGQRV